MTAFIQPGAILDFVAGAGGVTAGNPVIVGGFFVVPLINAVEGAAYSGAVDGVFEMPAATHASTQAATAGQIAYWDNTAKVATITATNNTKIGLFSEAKVSTAAIARVLVKPIV